MTDDTDRVLMLTLSARITELEADVATLRQMLEPLGVSPEQYEAVHAREVAERRKQHSDQLKDALWRERDRRAAIDRLLRTHEDEPQ